MKLFIFIILTLILLTSCNDSPTKTNDFLSGNTYKPPLGLQIIFDYYEIDGNGNPIPTNDNYYKSWQFIVGKGSELLKISNLTYLFKNSLNQGMANEYFSFDSTNQKIYMYSSSINEINASVRREFGEDSLPIELPNKWITIADFQTNRWTIFEQEISNYPCFFESQHPYFELKLLDGKFSAFSTRLDDEIVKIGTNEYTSTPFLIEEKLDAKISSIDGRIIDQPFIVEIKIKTYFVKGFGMVKRIIYNIPVTLYNDTSTINGRCIYPKGLQIVGNE